METATSLSRICRLALIGLGAAFAGILLTLLMGIGATGAHAEEQDDERGLLGAVTSLVDATATTVTETVSVVGVGVVDTVGAVAPPVVQQPVESAVSTAGDVIAPVTQPVIGTLDGGVVTAVVTPAVTLVSGVPLVGDLATGLGLTNALRDLGETLDATVGSTTDLVVGITDGAAAHLTPLLPPVDAFFAAAPAAASTVAAATVTALVSSPVWAAIAAAPAEAAASIASIFTAGLCLPSSANSAPAGAGSAAWALVAVGPLVAYRAWMRRAGLADDVAPPAPAQSTDVSPD